MDFDSFVGLIARSCPADWNVIVCWGYGSGPSYKSKFEYNDIVGGKVSGVLSEESHGMYACIKSNILVSLAFGLTANDDFREPWANGFPDPSASSHYWICFTRDLWFTGLLMYWSMVEEQNFRFQILHQILLLIRWRTH